MQINSAIHLILAQAGKEGSSPLGTLMLIPIMLVVMYFLVIRPQRNEEKKRKDMITSLTKGDSVVTSSGIHGKVVEIREAEQQVVLSVSPNTNITFTTSSILSKKDS